MKRYFLILILSLLICSQAFGANFYWKSSLAELNAITGVTNADKAVVMDANGNFLPYDHLSGAWRGSIINGMVDVRAYGAKGDNTTDDTAAIQAAVNAAKAAGGGTVFLPNGVYRLESEVLIDSSNIRIVGTGNSYSPGTDYSPCTVIVAADNMNGFNVHHHGVQIRNISFSDFQITTDGDRSNPASVTGRNGIVFQGGYDAEHPLGVMIHVNLTRMTFSNLNRGVWLYDNTGYSPYWMIDNVKVDHCQFVATIVGIEIDAGNASNINVVSSSFSNWNSIVAIGMYLKRVGFIKIDQCTFGSAAAATQDEIFSDASPHNGWGIKVVAGTKIQMWGTFCAEGSRGILYAPTGGAFSYETQWVLVGNLISELQLQGSMHLVSVGNQYFYNSKILYNGTTTFGGNASIRSDGDYFIEWAYASIDAPGYSIGDNTLNITGMNVRIPVGRILKIGTDNTLYKVTAAGAYVDATGKTSVTVSPNLAISAPESTAISVRGRWDLDSGGSSFLTQEGRIYQGSGGYGSRFPWSLKNAVVNTASSDWNGPDIDITGNYRVETTVKNSTDNAHIEIQMAWIDEDNVVSYLLIDNSATARPVGSITYPSVMVRARAMGYATGGLSFQYKTDGGDGTAIINIVVTYLPPVGEDNWFDQNKLIR